MEEKEISSCLCSETERCRKRSGRNPSLGRIGPQIWLHLCYSSRSTGRQVRPHLGAIDLDDQQLKRLDYSAATRRTAHPPVRRSCLFVGKTVAEALHRLDACAAFFAQLLAEPGDVHVDGT